MAEPKRRIGVLIVDDHRMFADALRLALDGERDVKVVGMAGGADQVDSLAGRLRPVVGGLLARQQLLVLATGHEPAAMLGVRVNLPVRTGRRNGAVAEAEARVAQRRAELAQRVNQVNFEVQQAYAQVLEGERTVRLYEEKILPAARKNVDAAASAYESGKIPFVALIEAEERKAA